MLTDPIDKDYILLETDEEAQAAFDVGYITKKPQYVERIIQSNWRNTFMLPILKKFIRVLRNEEKIKEMMKFLESK